MSSSQENGHHHRAQDGTVDSQTGEYVTASSSGQQVSQSSNDHYGSHDHRSSSANTSPTSSFNPTSSPVNFAESDSS